MRYPLTFTLFIAMHALLGAARAGEGESNAPERLRGLPLVFSDGFDEGMLKWEMTDPNAWAVVEEESNKVLALERPSVYEPPFRSPLNIARVKGLELTDFILEVRVKQTGKDYGHRDLCFFFGYQDPAHFYYAHLATKADEHANSIFIVNGAPRVSIADERTPGTDWGRGVYHTVRVERTTADGAIRVYFNDLEKPIMSAVDKTFLSGGVGLGSFDDTGRFDNVRIWGKKPERKEDQTDGKPQS